MTNAADIERIVLSLDSLNLLRRKVIIEDMVLEGIRFGTPRKTSGAIAGQPVAAKPGSKKEGQEKSRFKFLSFQVPNVQELLKREELHSLKLIESLRTDIQTEKKVWRERLQELPDKEKFEGYRSRIKKLTSQGKMTFSRILGGAGELKSLQEDIKRDLNNIRDAEKEFHARLKLVRERVDQARKAPLKDARRLREKYGFSARGIENMSQIFFGPNISQSVHKILAWYQRLRPAFERAKQFRKGGKESPDLIKPIRARGMDVRFTEYEPLPDFLIRMANASLHLRVGDLGGKIENITPDQDVLGIPLTFVFSGDNLKALESVRLNGELNHIKPSKSKDAVNLLIRGYQVQDVSLSGSEELPIVLKEARADLRLRVKLSGETIDANMLASFHSARIVTEAKKDTGFLVRAVTSSLSDIKKLNITVDISGTLDNYDVRVSSDLDRVLKNAIGKQVKEQTTRLEEELKTAISEKVRRPLSDLKINIGEFDVIGGELASRLQEGSGVLKGTSLFPHSMKQR